MGCSSTSATPGAYEDDAQRAVQTGLGIVEAMAQLNPRLGHERGVQLAVRLGIHTGLVVGDVGGDTRQEQLVLGETPNVAARLQGIAAPNTKVRSDVPLRRDDAILPILQICIGDTTRAVHGVDRHLHASLQRHHGSELWHVVEQFLRAIIAMMCEHLAVDLTMRYVQQQQVSERHTHALYLPSEHSHRRAMGIGPGAETIFVDMMPTHFSTARVH
jgi:hypothetical protein